ncbi:MAG: hypothetical protein AB1468_00940 [Candidatus Micrarchaeota archaeon]
MVFLFQGEAFAPREERKELLTPKERVDVSRIFMGIANAYHELERQFKDAKNHNDIERMRKTEKEITVLALANLQKGFFKDKSGSVRPISPYVNYSELRLDEPTRGALAKLTAIANETRASANIRDSSIPAVIHEPPIEEKITKHVIVNLEYQVPQPTGDVEASPLFADIELKPRVYRIEETHVITEPVALVSIGSVLRDLATGEDPEKMAQDPDFARSQQFQELRLACTAGTSEEVHKRFEQIRKKEEYEPYKEVVDIVEEKALKRFEAKAAPAPTLASEPAFTELAKLNLNEPPTQEAVARFSAAIEEFRKLAEDPRYASQKYEIEALAEKYESALAFWQRAYTPSFADACMNLKYAADEVDVRVPVVELMLHREVFEDLVKKLSKETRERLDKEPNQNITKITNAYEHPAPAATERMSEELSLKPDLSSGELALIATPKDIDKMLADETPQSKKFSV